jgi:hypothetical protein
MYRKLFKFIVTILTILTANLLTTYISNYLTGYKYHLRPIVFTLVAMGIITLVFYPLFSKLEYWINSLSVKIVKSGSSFGGKYLGLMIVFLFCICILTYFYANLWYKIDLLKALFNGTISHLW